jgi:hypothetical protein
VTDYRVWPATNGPDSSGSDGTPINLGLEFYVTTQAWCTHARVYRGTADVEPDNLRLYQVDSPSTGTMLAEITSPVLAGTGWQEVEFDTPIELTPLQAYKIVSHNPDHYTPTGGYWAPGGPGEGGITNGILVAPDTSQIAAQATFGYGAPAYPTGTFGGGNYWVDVVVTDTDPTAGGAVDLDGTAHSASSATGTLGITRSYIGVTSDADGSTGEMGATRDVTGATAAASTSTGTLTSARALTGSTAAAASSTASLTVVTPEEPGEPPNEVFSLGTVTTAWSLGAVSTGWSATRVD